MSPALAALDVDVVVPGLLGFDGAPGFESPPDYLGWLTALWDALDATGALPCPVIGASLGGMLAADLAALRPEAVTRLALLAPLGIFDRDHPTTDLFARSAPERLELAVRRAASPKHSPRSSPTAGRKRPRWRSTSCRSRRRACSGRSPTSTSPPACTGSPCRRSSCGAPPTRSIPVDMAKHWPLDETVVIPGAGHMVEWDAPDAVADALRGFLDADG